jgi:hypothetical protein
MYKINVPMQVNKMGLAHRCPTCCKLRSSCATQEWVEKHALAILKKTPNKTAKAIQVKLMADYNVEILYHIVWKDKERALKTLYGDGDNSFRLLYSFKAEIQSRSQGSVVDSFSYIICFFLSPYAKVIAVLIRNNLFLQKISKFKFSNFP